LGVDSDSHTRPFTSAGARVFVFAALGAETLAGLAAERLHGEAQDDRFADLSVDRQGAAVVEVNPAIFFIQRRMALHIGMLDLSTEDLEVQFEILREVGQAAAAFLLRLGLDATLDPDLVAAAVEIEDQAEGSLQDDVGRGDPDRFARDLQFEVGLAFPELAKIDLHRGV
jgi:hypothetical protein